MSAYYLTEFLKSPSKSDTHKVLQFLYTNISDMKRQQSIIIKSIDVKGHIFKDSIKSASLNQAWQF